MTFFDGAIVRDVLVDLDDDAHRLVWTIVDGPYMHHNGSAQALPAEDRRTRFVWTTDLLPNELAAGTAQRMQEGLKVIKETLEFAAAQP